MNINPSKIFDVYQDRNRLYTINLTPKQSFFQERLIKKGSKEFREWDPRRSKLAAAILKGCHNIFIRKNDIVLYLGASHGYTPSFVSDIIGENGYIFALDLAPRTTRDLVFLCEKRKNIIPIMADANQPNLYLDKVCQADIIYQDVAQRNQAEIFLKNINLFLKPGGYALLAVKARSIDIKKKPKVIFNEVRTFLEKHTKVIDFKTLEPYQKDHAFIIIKNV
ncbi:MAG: fibrillarin-like rRNA/tRNA 2'-O-methyltransferase [Nanoarchaeota archaeon]|nr:fibrillarin-like rRNA/tRNA 2'-O-methyltransferase [Nanoarchaeota archaeon]